MWDLYGTEISKPHSFRCYVSIHYVGRIPFAIQYVIYAYSVKESRIKYINVKDKEQFSNVKC
jgi:hypothetical protein